MSSTARPRSRRSSPARSRTRGPAVATPGSSATSRHCWRPASRSPTEPDNEEGPAYAGPSSYRPASALAGADLLAGRRGRDGCLGRRGRRGRLLDREEEAAHRRQEGAHPVHLLRYDPAGVLQLHVSVLVGLGQRLVYLVEPAVHGPPDDARLDAVREDLPVVLLEPERRPVRDVVRQGRQEQQPDPAGPGRRVETEVQLVREDVVATRDQQHHEERDRHRAQTGPDGYVAGALEQVMGRLVLHEAGLDERVEQ